MALCPPTTVLWISISTSGAVGAGSSEKIRMPILDPPGSVKISTRGSPATRSTAGQPGEDEAFEALPAQMPVSLACCHGISLRAANTRTA